ncbi:MAG: hypothetical protein EBZ95_13705, partial [Chitinophagia bacterium]|nr:hypothetical protein [Chitinophagia bacterium]
FFESNKAANASIPIDDPMPERAAVLMKVLFFMTSIYLKNTFCNHFLNFYNGLHSIHQANQGWIK